MFYFNLFIILLNITTDSYRIHFCMVLLKLIDKKIFFLDISDSYRRHFCMVLLKLILKKRLFINMRCCLYKCLLFCREMNQKLRDDKDAIEASIKSVSCIEINICLFHPLNYNLEIRFIRHVFLFFFRKLIGALAWTTNFKWPR